MSSIILPKGFLVSVARALVSSDYATVAYSYNDGDPDPELKRFSIHYDRLYVLPMLRLARKMNPDLFVVRCSLESARLDEGERINVGGKMRKSSLPYMQLSVNT